MRKPPSLFLLITATIIAVLTGCSVSRGVMEGEYLLVKNSVRFDKSHSSIRKTDFDAGDLSTIIQQQPNKKLFGIFPFGLWINRYATRGNETGLKRWMNKSFGEDPVILDTFLIQRSVEQLDLYLNNQGFFKSHLQHDVIRKKHKAKVTYNITLSEPYIIRNINYETTDSSIKDILINSKANSKIRHGQVYNASNLDDERYRITDELRNEGYYYFSPEYIYYKIDSTLTIHQLDIFLHVHQLQVPSDSMPLVTLDKNHQKYLVNSILINTDYHPLSTDQSKTSTILYPAKSGQQKEYIFSYPDKLKIRPKALINSIYLEPMELYSLSDESATFKQLSSLPVFGYTSIGFKPTTKTSTMTDSSEKYLDCLINLTRRPVQSFSVETEGTTSGGKLGMAGNFVYQNLNIFRGAELLTIKFTGGVEWQQGGNAREDIFWFFSTIETGAEAGLDIPKFILPVAQDRISRALRPRTSFKTGVNYQNRPDYKRYITNFSFGYNWRSKKYNSHSLIPLEINSVSIFPDSAFVRKINDLNDPRLTNQYTDHFIMALKYSFIYNDQERNKVKNFTFFRWNIESAGNLLNLGNKAFDAPKNEDGYYTVWNIPFAQYVRSDIDFRYYFAFNEDNTLVYRNLFGLGIPYGNSMVLPFEKGFYAGGASDMRGWRYRSLGPGSFADTSSVYFEKMGDIILEANLEYRFPIYSFFKGALFADFGNIWLLNNSENYPGGKLTPDKILNEIAIDAGLGIRFDFSFFIFRIDGAAPLRDPSFPQDQRWQFNTLQLKDVIWNFGIGYPF